MDNDIPLGWAIWLLPLINILTIFLFLIVITIYKTGEICKKINESNNKYFKWFRGDNW